ncbi:hypothetical protein M153_11277000369, partial [Pseudoloma neurophilia]
MLIIFLQSLLAIDYTIGTHHILDRDSNELTMAALGTESPVMTKRSNIWRDPSEDPTITFVNNKIGFTILIGRALKLCATSSTRLNLCPSTALTPDNGDDFRLVVGARGTSIRNKRNCLKIKTRDMRRNIRALTLVPCKDGNYSFFDIKSTTDAYNGPSPYNQASPSYGPMGWMSN